MTDKPIVIAARILDPTQCSGPADDAQREPVNDFKKRDVGPMRSNHSDEEQERGQKRSLKQKKYVLIPAQASHEVDSKTHQHIVEDRDDVGVRQDMPSVP